ncbi:PilZ domain-containing protein [Rhabdochromatium marinum]|uniref:PilZ domain-containing protein n=1 Tax=Rhabdochromatium marinum TaxID=48729 RepID=UPI00190823E1|nr:PilZ domain-containing protein [Rhabdochromatium marinum]MBK1647416.1 pilus assembly protein PilZ [Rhabdochromatium marinum]
MRQYLRHPSDIPILYRLGDLVADRNDYLRNIGYGGLCFRSHSAVSIGTKIYIEIPIVQPEFKADGIVAWCRAQEHEYEVGVRFSGVEAEYGVRMVEQVCQIEHYSRHVRETEGRELTSEEAAVEWIDKYAAGFPG